MGSISSCLESCITSKKHLDYSRIYTRIGPKENVSFREKKSETGSLLFFFYYFFLRPGLTMRTTKNFSFFGFFVSFPHRINTSVSFFS